jgi:DNA-binding NarL/FixJ family response regulator
MIESSEAQKDITIASVTKNCLVRLGLQGVIESDRQLQLVGEATSEQQAEAILAREKPDVFVIEMTSEFDLCRLIARLRASSPQVKVLLLGDLGMNPSMWEKLAADGMVLTCQPPSVLVASIHYAVSAKAASVQSETVVSPDRIQKSLSAIHSANRRGTSHAWQNALTDREREIIALAGQGLSNKDIADRLCIACTTVRHHLTRIFDKLGVTSRQQLLIRAHQQGLVTFQMSA